ncbi:phage head spike fiber domain-containing protein [Aeromonas sp. Y318-3]|uniref:phage head spike fiber domain-containing protein n=1 Tax=Aeromonas sp. Y318-3 TaxID=2990509 RepID=UPI0022E2A803|nr:hypothetical protein [Aeromonas sp. Y318-3]
MAVNDKDPTEAILLVEQTIGTFNQIVVGQEGQMVPVPGHPDQPTLAERVKQNIKPSTDAASGFAAQAAASAKAADDAAKQASQISGLETVADAIGLAALPLPDVWAPLSDSLRLITGYGRDVLVGSDVVARMVNFSRNSTATYIGKDGQLKTAAANEPRFEKEGLLLEGASTNLFPWSQEFIGKWKRVDGVASPDVNFPNAVSLNDSALGYVHTSVGNLNVGSPYSILAIVKGYVEGSTDIKGIFANGGQDSSKVVGRYGPYTVLSFVCNAAVNINPNVTGLTWAPGKATGIILCALQIEALPFSSSYIPTAGAAVTRAADQAWIPAAGNRFIGGLYAAAFEFDLLGKVPGNALHRLIDFDNSGGSDRQHLSINDANALILTMGSPAVAVSVAGSQVGRAAFRMSNYMANVMFNGIAGNVGAVQGVGSSINNRIVFMNTNIFNIPTYGHIRNLRMWSKHPISNDQLRTAV